MSGNHKGKAGFFCRHDFSKQENKIHYKESCQVHLSSPTLCSTTFLHSCHSFYFLKFLSFFLRVWSAGGRNTQNCRWGSFCGRGVALASKFASAWTPPLWGNVDCRSLGDHCSSLFPGRQVNKRGGWLKTQLFKFDGVFWSRYQMHWVSLIR